MRWRKRQCRSNFSYFILLVIFVLSGILFFTQLIIFDRSKIPQSRFEELQGWDGRTEYGSEMSPGEQNPQDGVWQRVVGTRMLFLDVLKLVLPSTRASPADEPERAKLSDMENEKLMRFKFYVYSAYVEMRTVAAVRIIAATKTRGADPVVCRLWLPDNRTVTLRARVKAIRENWNLRYSATYILCLLSDSGIKPQETVGAFVSVLASAWADKPQSNMLIVLDTKPKENTELQPLQVCVKPIHSSFSRAAWLVEWFEFNLLLGASHFYMYNHSMSAAVSSVMDYYRGKGLVTLLPWALPLKSKVEIRTEGLFAAFNDCLYRSMRHAEWLLVVDVDELVLPRQERTLPALLTASRKMAAKPPSAFLFRNAFFYLFWKDDPKTRAPLLTARKTRRRATPLAVKIRSKYAVRPRDMLELGNHFVWEHAPGALSAAVPAERALLHHYRDGCEFDDLSCLAMPSTVDRTAHRWLDELLVRVKQVQDTILLSST